MRSFFRKNNLIILIIAGLSLAGAIFAFTGPSQAPTGGNSYTWQMNGTNSYYLSGNVGIGTTTPAYLLSVSGGDIYASGAVTGGNSICIDSSCWTQWYDIPSGAVMFFNLSSCPAGWSEFTSARGRYAVGLNLSGTLDATVGTALSNQENRPVGQHTHTINDPTHIHSGDTSVYGPGSDAGGGHSYMWWGAGNSGSGVSITASGTVAGTNAPYIQYLVCKKG